MPEYITDRKGRLHRDTLKSKSPSVIVGRATKIPVIDVDD